MSMDGLWIGQVAMAALMNVAFAFAVGSALFGAWLAKDAQAKIAPARPGWLRPMRAAAGRHRLEPFVYDFGLVLVTTRTQALLSE